MIAPRCSIVIPVHNQAALTRQCLEALLGEPAAVSHETIVVDDASTDSTAELLSGYADRVRVISRDENGGFAAACNDGAVAAGGKYLVFLNNDTIPTAGWLDTLVAHL
jgi:GT2 family glycosyltransferase